MALASLLLAAKMAVQLSARALVSVDVLVDALIADANTLFGPKPPGDLLSTPVMPSQLLYLPPCGTAEPKTKLGRSSFQRQVVHLLGRVAP